MSAFSRIIAATSRLLAVAAVAVLPANVLAQTSPGASQPGGAGSIGSMQGGSGASRSPLGEIVDRTRLRVCADPGNLPYSDENGAGFENEIAELIADELGVAVEYTWFPQTVGFVRMTLGSARCDLVIGVATTNELMQNTNPYYRASYMVVHRGDLELQSGDLGDPAYDSLRIGLQPGTPGATTAARHGHLDQAKHYPLIVDTRIDKPARDMVQDVADGVTDAALVWGPLAGYWIREIDPSLAMQPLDPGSGTERVDYRISMGIRHGENDWKDDLNAILLKRKPEIDAILQSYNVPLIDNAGNLIPIMALPDHTPETENDRSDAGGVVQEPEGYRMGDYRAPVPAGLEGAETIDLATMQTLAQAPDAVLIDVMTAQRRPADRPADAIWREPERETIAGANWLANMGYGALEPREEAAFRAELDRLTEGDRAKPLVFFCEPDCWMSWNAAKRAVSYGFTGVRWYPEGVSGWAEAGGELASIKPWRPEMTAVPVH